jgi:glycosyltransferase involved in cell wall biosynthesis
VNFSVLMSVYHGENPAHLRDSLQSLFDQTQCPGEIVLVEDGPLTPGLEREIERARQAFPSLRTIRLPQNGGLGAALNSGLAHCVNEIVARMDTAGRRV